MSSQGSVIVRVYTSDAYLPLEGVPVVISQVLPQGRNLLAVLTTNSSGLTEPLSVETPDAAESLSPGSLRPYAEVDIQVSYPGYTAITAQGVRVFPGVETIQGLRLRPVPVTAAGENQILVQEGQHG